MSAGRRTPLPRRRSARDSRRQNARSKSPARRKISLPPRRLEPRPPEKQPPRALRSARRSISDRAETPRENQRRFLRLPPLRRFFFILATAASSFFRLWPTFLISVRTAAGVMRWLRAE